VWLGVLSLSLSLSLKTSRKGRFLMGRGGGGEAPRGCLFRVGDIISGLYIPWPEVVVPKNVPLVNAEGVQKNRAESMDAESAIEEPVEEDVGAVVSPVHPPFRSPQIWHPLYSREANRAPDSIKFPKMRCIP
jgi:hypothetical protein